MRILASVGALLFVVLVVIEVSMQPTSNERLTFLLLFGGAAALTLALARLLPSQFIHLRSVRHSLALAPLLALAVAAGTVLTSAGLMFLSSHDLRVFIAALGLGVGLAIVLSRALSERLETDLASLAATAGRVAAGDRRVRTGIDRADEIGTVARSVDAMIEQLSAGEEARTRLLASLSHDLRTPLSAMQVAVEALQDGVAEDPRRYLASISNDIGVMAGLVDNLFLLARLEARSVEFEAMPVDLAELADDAAEALGPVAARREVTIDIQARGNTRITGAPGELGRAIRNLLDNALRYAPRHTRVLVTMINGGANVTLQVADQGPGFAPAIRESAFDAFATSDPARTGRHGGTGLGLAIVKGIVEAHNGTLWIGDGPGGSVAFRVPSAQHATPD
ncbi:MAG: HAMP domain-containing histidine kinase [Acidimicrobiia bacterium]|nr:HAMP domain-containing histidine kinase [Acidimicrobiia bacterium]